MSFNRRSRKLFDALTNFDEDLIAAIFTTYNFDGKYFEGVLLPKLLGVRIDEQEDERIAVIDIMHKLAQTDIVVVADGRVNKSQKVKNLYGYDFVPVFEATQHAKIFLMQFENSFRLIIGSANLTESGLHKNREVYVEIDIDEDSSDWPLLNSVLDFLQSMSKSNGAKFDRTVSGFRAHASKLSKNFKPSPEYGVKFVGIEPEQGKLSFAPLLKQFFKEFKIEGKTEQRVDELYVLSPFFEEEKAGAKSDGLNSMLAKEYLELKGDHPRYPSLYLYLPTRGENITTLFPQVSYTKLSEHLKDCFIVFENPEVVTIEKKEQARFPHGKLYAITYHPNYTMTVLGSSNFSPSGFGQRSKGDNNWEANIAIFTPTVDKSTLKAMFPKDQEIDDDIWMRGELVTEDHFENPDATSDELVVLVDATHKDGKLYLRSLIDGQKQFKFLVGQIPIKPEWKGLEGVVTEKLQGVGVEVRDSEDKIIQDLPIHFTDGTGIPIDLSVSSQDMVNWIESRYLYKRHMPLSMLLEKFKQKSPSRKGQLAADQISTDDYLIYRVKTYNNLVARIFDHLYAQRDHAKRVEYHLLGKFGLINCVSEYIESAQKTEIEVFSIYQAAEVISSVLAAFEGATVHESLAVVREFWAQSQKMLKAFDPKSPGASQLKEYISELNAFANKILVKI